MFHKTTLKNGLRIITVPIKSTKAVTILVLVGAGSKYETKDINGISHFLEHMFFKGTKRMPDKLAIAETLDKVGGIYNAFTGREYTGYFAKVDHRYFNLASDWVSDIFLHSKIEEKEIDKERGTIIEEINMYLDMPMAHVEDFWEKLLYRDQPAGWFNIGEKEIVKKLKRKHFLDYLRTHYTAKNTVVCVAGNIDRKSAEEKIKKCFRNIRVNLPKKKLKVIEKQSEPQCLIHFKKTDQTHLILGVRGYDLFHPKKYAQTVLATILGGNMSSRLFMSVREKMGLAYHIRTSTETYTDTGYLVTSAGLRNEKVIKAIQLILKEYERMKERKISQKELKKAKDYLKGRLSLSLESSGAQASSYAAQELLSNKILTLEEKQKKIDAVSRDDVFRTAQDLFQPQKLNLALIGPFKNKKEFQKILKI